MTKGDPLQFARLNRKLSSGELIRVMAIGSSVTGAFGGCTHSLSQHCAHHCGGKCYTLSHRGEGWARQFIDWVADEFPVANASQGDHELYNGGKSAVHIEHFAECLDSYLPSGDIDLFLIELTLPKCYDGMGESSLERLLRLVRLRGAAVIMLRALCQGPTRLQICHEKHIEMLARHYSIPFIGLQLAHDDWYGCTVGLSIEMRQRREAPPRGATALCSRGGAAGADGRPPRLRALAGPRC